MGTPGLGGERVWGPELWDFMENPGAGMWTRPPLPPFQGLREEEAGGSTVQG